MIHCPPSLPNPKKGDILLDPSSLPLLNALLASHAISLSHDLRLPFPHHPYPSEPLSSSAMASHGSSSPSPNGDSPFLFPLIFTFSAHTHPFAQTMLVIPGDDLLDDAKLGCPPASKESIKAMESVVIGEGGGVGDHCAVCLEEWRAGDVARVMPCGHRFHGDCIEKWIGVHGSCPVCRYEMPPEEEEEDAGKEREGGGRGRGGMVWVFALDFGGILGGQINSGDSGEAADADSSADADTEQD